MARALAGVDMGRTPFEREYEIFAQERLLPSVFRQLYYKSKRVLGPDALLRFVTEGAFSRGPTESAFSRGTGPALRSPSVRALTAATTRPAFRAATVRAFVPFSAFVLHVRSSLCL